MPRQFRYAAAVDAALLCLFAGCGGPARYDISGKVTFDGQPVPAGMIYFDPDATRQNDGPQGFAFIKDGTYSTAAEGSKGTAGGPYVVRVEGFDGQRGPDLPLGHRLFDDHQQPVDLPKSSTTLDINIKRE